MLEAPVLRTQLFQAAINNVCRGELDEALNRLTSLREQYATDPHSGVEIDRWIACTLKRADRKEEAYLLLRDLEPRLEQFQYDLSCHYLEVVTLQELLGRLDELQDYCRNIGGHYWMSDALGHLDWILRYALSSDDAQPTDFMYTVLVFCTIQLGLEVPARGIAGRDFRICVERCIKVRDRGK